ncbi:hypothetical protein SO802_016881 [Lithocarpus litseifolius]|uniref:PPM-type phosphatase domain-containing protein n=1 Tax=Lithocarpus litseifolius TaxID=425828 RepID=A0AAW2D1W6_9ROSI
MVIFPSFLDGFTRSVPIKKEMNNKNDVGRETAEKLAKEAKKNELILSSSGTVKAYKSNNLMSVCSKRGMKGINQDCLIVWEVLGELKHHPGIDSFCSGTTALTLVKQGEHLVIANVGESRAVLATTSDDDHLVPLQLSIVFKPNLPQEVERIAQSKGLVFCLDDEPGVHRIWRPNGETPGLALSRVLFTSSSSASMTLRPLNSELEFGSEELHEQIRLFQKMVVFGT